MSQLNAAVTELKAAARGIILAAWTDDDDERLGKAGGRLEQACFAITPAADADKQAAVKAACGAAIVEVNDMWNEAAE